MKSLFPDGHCSLVRLSFRTLTTRSAEKEKLIDDIELSEKSFTDLDQAARIGIDPGGRG